MFLEALFKGFPDNHTWSFSASPGLLTSGKTSLIWLSESHSCISAFNMEVGDKVRVRLCSNTTTGFQWEYQMTQGNVLKEEDHDYEEPEGNLAGAAGTELWTFEAVGAGETEVSMTYSQSWEGGEKDVWTYTMMITVEE